MNPNNFKLKNKSVFMLIGKAENTMYIEKPKEKVIFIEELTDE